MANYSDFFINLEAFEGKDDEVMMSMLSDMHDTELITFVESLNGSIPHDSFETKSYFNFRPNSTLSGGSFPCAGSSCRVRNAISMARFAALYADKALINNPFENSFNPEGNRLFQIYDLMVAIKVVFALKPLIMAGIVGVMPRTFCFCQDCAARLYEAEESVNRYLSQVQEKMVSDLSDGFSCYCQYVGDNYYYFELDPLPEYGLTHSVFTSDIDVDAKTKRFLQENPDVKLTVPSSIAKELGISHYINPLLHEVYLSQMEGLINGGFYLTNRTADLWLLADAPLELKSKAKHIELPSIEFPMLDHVSIDELVSLREKHHDSFQVFRDTISVALSEFDLIDDRAAKEIKRDVIDPGMHRINNVINGARNDIKKRLLCDAGVISIVLGVGALSDALTPQLLAGMSILGTTHAVLDSVHQISSRFTPPEAKNDELYFLWKATKK